MRAGNSMNLVNCGNTRAAERRLQADQCRPQTAMYICDLSRDEATNQNIGMRAERLSKSEEFFRTGVNPPTTSTTSAKHLVCQIWYRTMASRL
jgi:hypothetical protein